MNAQAEFTLASVKDALIEIKKDVKSFSCLNDLIDTSDESKQINQIALSAILESLIQKLALDVDYLEDIVKND